MTGDEVREILVFLAVVPLQLLVFFGIPYLLYRRMKTRRPSTEPRPLIDEGGGARRVPVLATFGGFTGLPWVAASHNSLNPLLVLGPDAMTFRVIRKRVRRYAEVEQLDVQVFGSTVNLVFRFTGTSRTFTANVGNLGVARDVLALLGGRVPLGDGARRVAAGG